MRARKLAPIEISRRPVPLIASPGKGSPLVAAARLSGKTSV
jgi:hypothetical protein